MDLPAATPLPENLFPQEYLLAVRELAERDADEVQTFVRELLAQISPSGLCPETIFLPSTILTGIGMALRLLRWESLSIPWIQENDLPTSTQLLHRVCGDFVQGDYQELDRYLAQISARILRIHHEHFVWSVHEMPALADIAVISEVDAEFIDALCDFFIQQIQRDPRS
ncbi:hypothetical protein GC163_12495 [bacterium]|nr:hypothetical protein [bacterium]